MEILNINNDAVITRIQTAGGIVFVKEQWVKEKSSIKVQSPIKEEEILNYKTTTSSGTMNKITQPVLE